MKDLNYYEVLGLDKNASQQHIKQAYKDLAKQYHPDNQDSGDAVKMSSINEAYNALKNQKTKQLYDETLDRHNDHMAFAYNQEELKQTVDQNLDKIYSSFGRDKNFNKVSTASTKLKDVEVTFEINLEQAYTGYNSDVSVRLPSGEIRNLFLNIPAGIQDGDKILFKDLGNSNTKSASDLYVIVKILQHKSFTRNNNNLFTSVIIDSIDSMIGTVATIALLDNTVATLNIPAGVQHSENISIQNYGMPKLNSSSRGDLFVTVIIKTPTLNENQKNILKDLKNMLD